MAESQLGQQLQCPPHHPSGTEQGLGNEAEGLFHAYMTEGAWPLVSVGWLRITSRIGFGQCRSRVCADSDELTDFVRHDEKIAREQLNITGVPFFVFDQKLTLSGCTAT